MDITNCARLQQQTRLRHISQGIYNYIPSCGSNMRIRSFMKCFSPKADSAATEPYFPVFLRNVRYHAACTYNELWPCQIVRFWVPCKIPDWLMRHHEVLSDSKNKQCSVMFRNTLLRYFANNLYIPVLFTYRFFAILCDFRSLLSSYSGQHLPWPILLAFPSLLNLFYPLLIFYDT